METFPRSQIVYAYCMTKIFAEGAMAVVYLTMHLSVLKINSTHVCNNFLYSLAGCHKGRIYRANTRHEMQQQLPRPLKFT